MGKILNMPETEVLLAGERTDDEWEGYIREVYSPVEYGRRWFEYREDCRRQYKKPGGSHFSTFAQERFGYNKSTVSHLAKIGEHADELCIINTHFDHDWNAYYNYLNLPPATQKKLISQSKKSGIKISQKTIKEIKGTRGAKSSDRAIITKIDPDVRIGPFQEVLADIPQDSVKLILTDPPYGVEFMDLWRDLGQFASETLQDDGLLMAYCGKYAILDVMNILDEHEHLNYWWMSALFHEGSGHSTPLGHPVRKVISHWRPLLMFVKDRIDNSFHDVVPAGGKEKSDHNWQQAMSESLWIIEQYTQPGDLVVDPMAGSGTVAKACRETGRQFIGAEISG